MAALGLDLGREQRLRARIDELRDARDEALKLLWEAREENLVLQEQLRGRSDSATIRDLRKSRDMWRERARNAERMLRPRKRTTAGFARQATTQERR